MSLHHRLGCLLTLLHRSKGFVGGSEQGEWSSCSQGISHSSQFHCLPEAGEPRVQVHNLCNIMLWEWVEELADDVYDTIGGWETVYHSHTVHSREARNILRHLELIRSDYSS